MRLILNLLLLVAAGFLVYILISSIQDPIAFQAEKGKRVDAVVERLKEVRDAQKIYRDVTGGAFASNFNDLKDTLRQGRIPIVSVYGDADDPNFTGEIRLDTNYVNAIDSINSLGINLDSLGVIPYTGGKMFEIDADTTTYQSTLVNVTEVKTVYRDFMGKFADPSFSRYDQLYDPSKTLKFGSMSSPSLSGNWE